MTNWKIQLAWRILCISRLERFMLRVSWLLKKAASSRETIVEYQKSQGTSSHTQHQEGSELGRIHLSTLTGHGVGFQGVKGGEDSRRGESEQRHCRINIPFVWRGCGTDGGAVTVGFDYRGFPFPAGRSTVYVEGWLELYIYPSRCYDGVQGDSSLFLFSLQPESSFPLSSWDMKGIYRAFRVKFIKLRPRFSFIRSITFRTLGLTPRSWTFQFSHSFRTIV